MACAISSTHQNKENIIILEEPENNLHPKWQKYLTIFFSLSSVKKYLN
jgi:predicted ATPase